MNFVDVDIAFDGLWPDVQVEIHIDDLVVGASQNGQAFLNGVGVGIANVQTGLTSKQAQKWQLNWGTTYVAEQFLRGYRATFMKRFEDWENMASSAGNLIDDVIDDPWGSLDKLSRTINKATEILTNPKHAPQLNNAGKMLGSATAAWLNESANSPPEFARKCGELAAMIVWEAIETVATAGIGKALKIGTLTKGVIGKLPARMKRLPRGKRNAPRNNRLTNDKGTKNKELGRPRTKLDEVDEDVDQAVEEAFSKHTIDKKGSENRPLYNVRWTHDRGLERQSQSATLTESTERRTAGKQKDQASLSKQLTYRFARALKILESSFKKHSKAAKKNLPENVLKRLRRLDNLRNEMLVLAKVTRQMASEGENPLRITDLDVLRKAKSNYKEAKKIANDYGKLREETWKRIFTDKNLQFDLINEAVDLLLELKQRFAGGLTKQQVVKEIWPDPDKRNDILWRAFRIIWNKGNEGKAPRSGIVKADGRKGTHALNLEHIRRRTDNPYLALSKENLVPTTQRINVSINEAIRKIEREHTKGSITFDPSDDDLIEDFIRINRDLLTSK